MQTQRQSFTEDDVKAKTPQRFWAKILFGDINDCWIWQASKLSFGHGQFGNSECANLAHRFMYSHLIGPIYGLHVLHKCDNPSCVNPNHLFTGTQADNMHDMYSKGRNFKIPSTKGEEHPSAKLSNEDVKKIKFMLSKKETQLSVATKFGLSRSTISHIKNNHTWKHLV